ncbi:MAG: NUDIX hydrolase [Candidatus Hydrogenedentota bacterium]
MRLDNATAKATPVAKLDTVRPRIRVAAVIFRGREILLARHEKAGRSYWLLPGGGVEFGESLCEALVRELKEEANLTIEVGNVLFVNDMIAPERDRHVVHIFFSATVMAGELKCGADHRLKEVCYVPMEELAALTLFPPVYDSLLRATQAKREDFAPYLGALWAD